METWESLDGNHIAMLIMGLLYKLAPQFLEEGRLYWLRSPLYRVEKGKEVKYYYSDQELAAASATRGTTQTRFKGLGELADRDAIQMFNENQRMDQLIWDKESYKLLDDLLGKDVLPRKDFVFSEIDFERYGEI